MSKASLFKKPVTSALAVLISAMVTGCSGGVSSGEDMRAQQGKDAKVLEDLYSNVQGRWEGMMTNPAISLQPFKAEIILYTYYVQDGTNPDGSTIIRPALRGKFRPMDFVTETDVMTLTGDYDRNGQLRMTGSIPRPPSADSSVGAGEPLILSIRGLAAGEQMKLSVTRQGGVWGYFDATRTSTDASAPADGEAAEYRERFIRINSHAEGRYFGRLRATQGEAYEVEIDLVIIEQAIAGGSRPVLRAHYKRLPMGTLEWALSVDYNSQTGEIVMWTTPERDRSGDATMPGANTLSVTGALKKSGSRQYLDVEVRNKTSTVGSLEAVRRVSQRR